MDFVIHIQEREKDLANALYCNITSLDAFSKLKEIVSVNNCLKGRKSIVPLTPYQEELLSSINTYVINQKEYSKQKAIFLLLSTGAVFEEIETFEKMGCGKPLFQIESQPFPKAESGVIQFMVWDMYENSDRAEADIKVDIETGKIDINFYRYLTPSEFEAEYNDLYGTLLNYDDLLDVTCFLDEDIEKVESVLHNMPLAMDNGIVIDLL